MDKEYTFVEEDGVWYVQSLDGTVNGPFATEELAKMSVDEND